LTTFTIVFVSFEQIENMPALVNAFFELELLLKAKCLDE